MYDRSACTPFCTSEDLALHCPSFAASSPPEDPDEAILAASSILAMLSGFTVYGTCTAVVRPTGYICRHGLDAIPLQYPVREILDVMIDGASIDPASYDVIDDEFLVRLVDPGTRRNRGWSYCRQSLDLPATEVGTLRDQSPLGPNAATTPTRVRAVLALTSTTCRSSSSRGRAGVLVVLSPAFPTKRGDNSDDDHRRTHGLDARP